MLKKFTTAFGICCLLFAKHAKAQNSIDNSFPDSVRYKELINNYLNDFKENLLIYNGPEFVWTYPKAIGHPFFAIDSFELGTITFDRVVYYNIPMQYDIVKEAVIVKSPNDARIELATNKISSFVFRNAVFKKIQQSDLRPTFYQQLYSQKGVEVLVDRKKSLVRVGKAEDLDMFQEANQYYIFKDSKYHKINSAGELFKLFPEKEKMIKRYVGEKKLSFKKDPQGFINSVLTYYHTT